MVNDRIAPRREEADLWSSSVVRRLRVRSKGHAQSRYCDIHGSEPKKTPGSCGLSSRDCAVPMLHRGSRVPTVALTT